MEERESNKFHFQKVDDLTQVGMSSERLSQTKDWIEQKAGKTPYGCLILRNGKVAAEWYGGGFSAESLFEIGSIRKSFNSALIGIGLEEEKIDLIDLNVRAVDVWSDITKISGDPADETITLHQLISETSGWLTPDPPGKTFV